jgi:hypothetical protein
MFENFKLIQMKKNILLLTALVPFFALISSCDTRRDAEVKTDNVDKSTVQKFYAFWDKVPMTPLSYGASFVEGNSFYFVKVEDDSIVRIEVLRPMKNKEDTYTAHIIMFAESGHLIGYKEIDNWEKKEAGKAYPREHVTFEFPTVTPGAHYRPGYAEGFLKQVMGNLPKAKRISM